MSKESKLAFLRQSGWLAIATVIAGVTSYAVHPFIKDVKTEYGAFTAMLQLLNLIAIPAIGLQAVFAYKAAEAKTDGDHKRIAREQIAIGIVVFALAAVAFVWVHFKGDELAASMKLPSLNVLLVTLASGVFALLLPMVYGVLQGRQRFFWLGWAMLSLGVVRLAAAAGLVDSFGASALNGLVGVGIGFLCAFLLAGATAGLPSLSPREWLSCVTQVNWRDLARRFVPLSLGGGAVIYMMSLDMIVVQRFFDGDQTGYYAAAGMIGRSLIFFVGPMVMVMFPKIVRSRAEQTPTDVLKLTLLLTTGLCVVAVTLGILVPELPLRIIYDDSYLRVTPMIPWFIGAMVPLALAAVLVNNILARGIYSVIYWLILLPALYTGMLWKIAPKIAEQTDGIFNVHAYISMIQLIGMGNLCFLASTVILTWVAYQKEPAPSKDAAARH